MMQGMIAPFRMWGFAGRQVLVDVAFGMLNRVASQINVHQESQPVKAMAGLGVLLLASGFLVSRMQTILGEMMNSVTAMLHALRP